MTRQRVLVVGASGMLGHTLVPALRAFGFDPVAHGHSEGMDVQPIPLNRIRRPICSTRCGMARSSIWLR